MMKKNNNILRKNGGQAVLMSVVFFLFISLAIMFGLASPVARDISLAREATGSIQSFFLAEAAAEDVFYRLRNGMQVASPEVLTLLGARATTTIADVGSNEKEIVATGDIRSNIRKVKARLSVSSGASFNYGVQVGNGGFLIENTASVRGNIYSSGAIIGANSNIIRGDVISAGPLGLINSIHATSSAYAHTITNSQIDKDAYYQSISGTTVGGISYPGSADQPIADLPIADDLILLWEAAAEAGGIINSPCPYEIKNNITLGPVKINCDLKITGNPTITLTGALWVLGNINIENTATVRISPSLGIVSVPVIADKPTNRTTSSKIELENSATFVGNGSGSYVMVVSQNNSSELGGSEKAISVENSANGDLLLYASHGEVHIKNSARLKEVTGYKVHLSNSAEVTYETGLASLLFSAGPGGSWTIAEWKEVE